MTLSGLPPLISSDGHLEVRPERWTPHMPATLREKAPRTIKLPDGGDAILVEGQPPYPAPFLDLRAGRTNETWEPIGVTVDDTAGVGPPEQRLQEQDMDALHAEVLFPNMQVGPRLWRTLADDDVYRATVRAYNDWLGEEYCAVSRDRLIGLGVIPWITSTTPSPARACAKLGLKASTSACSRQRRIRPADDRFWASHRHEDAWVTSATVSDRALSTHLEYPAPIALLNELRPGSWSGWRYRSWDRAVDELRPAHPVRCVRSPPRPQIFFAETAPGVSAVLDGGRLLVRRHRHWARAPADFKPLKTAAERLRREHIFFSVSTWSGWPSSCITWAWTASCSPRTRTSNALANTRPFAEAAVRGVPAGEGQNRGRQRTRVLTGAADGAEGSGRCFPPMRKCLMAPE
jgi:hypothetical protein